MAVTRTLVARYDNSVAQDIAVVMERDCKLIAVVDAPDTVASNMLIEVSLSPTAQIASSGTYLLRTVIASLERVNHGQPIFGLSAPLKKTQVLYIHLVNGATDNGTLNIVLESAS